MNWSIFLMARESGLKLALGGIPLSSFPSLPPHLYPLHQLPAFQNTQTFLIPWSWEESCGDLLLYFFQCIYLYALLLQDKTYTRYTQTNIHPLSAYPRVVYTISQYSLNYGKYKWKKRHNVGWRKVRFWLTAEWLCSKRDVYKAKLRGLNLYL